MIVSFSLEEGIVYPRILNLWCRIPEKRTFDILIILNFFLKSRDLAIESFIHLKMIKAKHSKIWAKNIEKISKI